MNIIFTGDILLDRGVRETIEHKGIEYLFHPTIDSLFAKSDIVCANLECPATKICEPISKKYIFRAEPECLEVLNKHGITHINIANNHSMDQGRSGLVDTRNNIDLYNMIPLGFGENISNACDPQLVANKPRKVFILSSVQVVSENWTYLENKPCVCEESTDQIATQVKKLRQADPNAVIIVQFHWGMEHTPLPLTFQKQQAHNIIDAGADCIIGHHSHTIQTIEYFNNKPIFYSIGNFIFDQADNLNSEGLLIKIEITDSSIVYNPIKFKIDKCQPSIEN